MGGEWGSTPLTLSWVCAICGPPGTPYSALLVCVAAVAGRAARDPSLRVHGFRAEPSRRRSPPRCVARPPPQHLLHPCPGAVAHFFFVCFWKKPGILAFLKPFFLIQNFKFFFQVYFHLSQPQPKIADPAAGSAIGLPTLELEVLYRPADPTDSAAVEG